MSTQETAVTKSDLAVVREAIDLVTPLGVRLVSIKAILDKIGDLEERYRAAQSSLEQLEKLVADEGRKWEARRDELKHTQDEIVEKRKVEVELDNRIELKRQQLNQIETTIKARLEAA
jgi:chromosome segregation ATPase